MLRTQAFVCNLGFSTAYFFCGFIVNLFCNAYYFSGIICYEKSTVQYCVLIKTKIIILTEYVVMKEPLDEYYKAVFGFCSKQSSISSQVVFNILQL